MYAKLVRGGAYSDCCWSYTVYDRDGNRIDGGSSWWLLSDDAVVELRSKYGQIEIR